jgi:hypothetical protein
LYDRHKHGKASEYFVAYHLTNLGYDVVMVTGNPRYDMIIESEKGRLFVQVKSGIKKNDELKIGLRGNSDTKRYTSREIDIIVIHERSENKVIFLPINDIEGQVSICLRYNPPTKIYSHRTRLIENYIKFDEKWFDEVHNTTAI